MKGFKAVPFLVICAMLLCFAGNALGQTWSKAYGGNSVARDVVQTSDGGYAFLGRTSDFGAGSNDIWLVRLSATGDIVWEKTYGGAGNDLGYDLLYTPDGGYLVAGASNSFSGSYDIWVLKLDSSGTIEWQKTLDSGNWDSGPFAAMAVDDGYIIAANTDVGGGNYDYVIVKLTSNGSIDWQKTYGGSGYDYLRSICATPDNCYIVAGSTQSYGAGSGDFWALKIDASGNIVWQKAYGGTGTEQAYCPIPTSDGGYIMAGSTTSFGGFIAHIWVLKLDTVGNIEWEKVYVHGTSENPESIYQTSDNGFMLGGKTDNYMWVLRLDSAGEILWQKQFGDFSNDCANSVKQTVDGSYIIAGETQSMGLTTVEAWLLKLDISGAIDPTCDFIADTFGASQDTVATVTVTTATSAVSALTSLDTAITGQSSSATVTEHCSGIGCSLFLSVPSAVGVDAQLCSTEIVTSNNTPILEWSNVSNEGGFDWEVWTGPNRSGTMMESGSALIDETTATVPVSLADGRYHWVIKAIGDGETYCDSYWSESCEFSILGGGMSLTWARVLSAKGASFSVSSDSDGGYIFGGRIDPASDGNYDVKLFKSDVLGDFEWSYEYSGSFNEHLYAVHETLDNGYILGGYSNSFGSNGFDLLLMKTTSNGDIQWQKIYGGVNADAGYDMIQTAEGGYIACGETKSYGNGLADLWLLKLDSSGGVEWQKSYGSTGDDIATSIKQTADGGYIAAGYSNSWYINPNTDNGQKYGWVVKLDSSGNVNWQKLYGGQNDDEIQSIEEKSGGGYIFAGSTASFGAGDSDFWIVDLDASGNILWQKTVGGAGFDKATSQNITSDGSIALAGYTDSFGAGGYDLWAMKLNSSGAIEWQKTYGEDDNEGALSLSCTSDSGLIISGWTWSFSASTTAYWALKTDPNGEIGDACDFISDTYVSTQDSAVLVSSTAVTGTDTPSVPVDSTAASTSTYGASDLLCSNCEIVPPTMVSVDGQACAGLIETSDTTPTIEWADSAGEAGYSWQIWEGEGCYFALTASGTTGADVTSIEVTPALPEGIYSWRHKANGDGLITCDSDWVCGCPFEVIPLPLSCGIISVSENPVCFSAEQGFSTSPSGGTTPYRYQWDWTDDGSWDATGNHVNYTYPSSGVYTAKCRVTDAESAFCEMTVPVTVNTNPTPVITPDGPTTLCEGGSVNLDAGAGYASYLWSTSETTQTINVTTGGSYSILVTDGNGCQGISAPVVITVNPNPTPVITESTCSIGNVTLDAGTGYTSYLWNTAETTQTIEVPGDGTGYSVTVTDANGCSGGDSHTTQTCSQPSAVYWAKACGGASDEQGMSVIPLSDGGMVVAGESQSFGSGGWDIWINRLDPAGYILWQKSYGGSGTEYLNMITETSDGGYVMAAWTDSSGQGGTDLLVIKTDASGNVSWQKTYGGTGGDVANSVLQTGDGGYLVTGSTASAGAGSDDILVIKLSATGSLEWQKTYGGSAMDQGFSISPSADGNYYLGGHTVSFGPGNFDYWVLKIDPTGNVLWQKALGGGAGDYIGNVVGTTDGGCIAAGNIWSFGAGYEDAWIVRFDSSGTVLWQKTYGSTGRDRAFWIEQTADSGFIMTGETDSFGKGNLDFWTIKLDGTGTVQWQKTYGDIADDRSYSVTKNAGGGYSITGRTDSFGEGGGDLWVLKVDESGEIDEECTIYEDTTVVGTNTSASISNTAISGQICALTAANSSTSVSDTSAILSEQCTGLPPLPPLEVSPSGTSEPLIWADSSTLEWEDASTSGSNIFNLYRGNLNELSENSYGACLISGITESTEVDTSTGGSWFYLVTGVNENGEGTMGYRSDAVERVNSNPCP